MNDNPITMASSSSYALADGYTTADAVEKLGEIEALVQTGELMPPGIRQGDTIYFIFRENEVLSGVVENVFTEYSPTAEKYLYKIVVRNEWYGVLVTLPAASFNISFFKTQEAANTALSALLNVDLS